MAQRIRIEAGDAVRDTRAGMTDSQLMEKYGLSTKGLQNLVLKLLEVKAITLEEIEERRAAYHDATTAQQINGTDLVKDIRSGMTDCELMQKYGLSPEELGFALQTLTDTKVIDAEELYGRSSSAHPENMRELPRDHLAMAIYIYEVNRPEISGILTNVSEKAIAVAGMAVGIGDTKTFFIPAEDFIEADPIIFEARCQLAEKGRDTGEWIASFEITGISEKCLEDLRRLIQSLPFLE
ncbi:MAG: hypothetical protein ACLQPD_19635 [Desulfomonilaceae bacterium]